MLRTTVNGFGYVALAGLAAEAAAKQANPMASKRAHFTGTAKRVILLFMQGGVSHVDTFVNLPAIFCPPAVTRSETNNLSPPGSWPWA